MTMLSRILILLALVLAVAALPKPPLDDLLQKGVSFVGLGTYYDVGPGSCGKTDTNDEMVVAVNTPQMKNGPNPNNNVRCNKMVYIEGDHGKTKARIVDTCPSCRKGALDMSPAVFKKVCGKLEKGKCNIRWKFL